VKSGDIIVGDADGVAVIPRNDAELVLGLVATLMEREAKRIAEIKSGALFKAEIDDTLRKHGIVE
jgi:regulator of RNase E activity RraA